MSNEQLVSLLVQFPITCCILIAFVASIVGLLSTANRKLPPTHGKLHLAGWAPFRVDAAARRAAG